MNFNQYVRLASFFFLTALLFTQTGCAFISEEELIGDAQLPSLVYLSVPEIQILGSGLLKNNSSNFDDRIHDLGILVFDSSTGLKVGEYFNEGITIENTNINPVVKITPGLRDFYFVANTPLAALKGIKSKAQMESYMNELQNLDASLFWNITADKGFPMSRVYANELVVSGGTAESPIMFYPEGDTKVQLIRCVAKLEVRILDGLQVESIYYRNAFRKFSLNSLPPLFSAEYYPDTLLMKKDSNTYMLYMPEAILPSGTVWGTGDYKPVNYFVVRMTSGIEYEIPIITANNTDPLNDYLSYAKGELSEKPNYTIYRNTHYMYYLSASKVLRSIEVSYQVLPWVLENKAMYMGYWFNLETNGTDLLITNTVKAFPPHRVRLEMIPPSAFEDGSTERLFDDYTEDAFALYKISSVPSGNYLNIYYNDVLVKTISK